MFMTLGVADLESFAERWEMHLHRRSERSPPQRRWSFLSLMPSILIRNLLFGALATPYIWIVGHLPFPYHDKPWFVSPAGALATAIAWVAIIYTAHCLFAAKKGKQANKSPEATPGQRPPTSPSSSSGAPQL
jgi:hypothetical protein